MVAEKTLALLNIHNHLMNAENEGMIVTGQQDVTPEGLNIIPSTVAFQPHFCVFRLSPKCLYLPNLPSHNGARLQTKVKVKQFPKRWWKRKPLKMLFVYEAGFLSCLYIHVIYLSIHRGAENEITS